MGSTTYRTEDVGGEGAVELWYGPLEGAHTTMTSTATLPASAWAARCGVGSTYSSSVAGLGDFTGNGASDLAVACLGYTGYTDAGEKAFVQGGVWIVPGLGMQGGLAGTVTISAHPPLSAPSRLATRPWTRIPSRRAPAGDSSADAAADSDLDTAQRPDRSREGCATTRTARPAPGPGTRHPRGREKNLTPR